jgi:hypothetical protein
MGYTLKIGSRRFHGLRGNLHMHTPLSDGTKGHAELGGIAAEAGLDFIVVTDHNVYQPGLDGWVGDTLILVGEEIHDPERQPQSSHTLCFAIQKDVVAHGADPEALMGAVVSQGGFTFLAHPFERDVAEFLPEPNISWRDWEVDGYAGIELWNYMSEFKSVLKNKVHAVLYAYAPDLAVVGPYPETLRKWDELLVERRVAAFGGSDAHGTVYHIGPLSRVVQPYSYLFGCINTHLLSEEPLNGDLEHDKAVLYEALRMGRGFLGYERPGEIAGFSFWARSGSNEATMGETLVFEDRVELRVSVPYRARLRLLRNGQLVAQAENNHLVSISHAPGVYRLEAYRQHVGRERGWIFSNPIYVE